MIQQVLCGGGVGGQLAEVPHSVEFVQAGSTPIEFASCISDRRTCSYAPYREEAFGMALIEAMACGVPVVARAAEGIPGVCR